MLLIPYNQYQFQINTPPGDVLQALRSNVETDPKKFNSWKTWKPLVGYINATSFKIYRPRKKTNADYFPPVITGRIKSNTLGTSIQISMRLGISGLSYALFMMLIGMTFIIRILFAIPLNYLQLIVALLITLAFYTFVLLMFKREARKDLKIIESIFAEERLDSGASKSNRGKRRVII
jgi:hypothetical protein